jgi:hypothetical protein
MHALIPQSSRFGLAQLLASAAFSGVRTHVRHVFPDLRKSGRSAKDLPARTHQNQSVAGHLQGICCVLQGIARHTRLVSLPFCMLCAGQQDSYRPVRIAMRKNHLSVRQRCRRDCRTADHLISSVFRLVMDLATYRQVRCGPAPRFAVVCIEKPGLAGQWDRKHVSWCGTSLHIATFRVTRSFARLHCRRRPELA